MKYHGTDYLPYTSDKASGLPHSVILDCGKDYKSALLEDIPDYYRKSVENEDSICLNQRFSGLGILRAFNVDVYHCLPYHPQSKPIERCFSSIENHIEKLPGWCYRNVANRPQGFQKHLNNLLETRQLYTLEEFSRKFATEILPAYHGQMDTDITNPDIPGWKLDISHMTPMQRYENLPKSRSLIPSYKTISVIKKHFEADCLIQAQGIRFKYVYYDADELKSLRGQKVDILYFKVAKPFAPSSITVIYQSEYLCEAFPISANSYTNTDTRILSQISHEQNSEAGKISNAVTRINKSVAKILPDQTTASDIEKFQKTQVGQREQLREEAYSVPYQEEEETPVSNDTDTTLPDITKKKTSKKLIQQGLDFLLGTDDTDF